MFKMFIRWAALCAALLGQPMQAQEVRKSTLGIAAITPTDSLKAATQNAGKTTELGRALESLDTQLIDRINATRKFQIMALSDLKELIKRQEQAQSGNFDSSDRNLAQQFKFAGSKYFLLATVDDFEDVTITEELKIQKEKLLVRSIRLSVVAKIFDSTTGALLESANFQTMTNKTTTDFNTAGVQGNRTDVLLVAISRDLAEKVARRVTDVIFPARVLAKRDKQITINRGDGTGIAVGQVWDVFALGDQLVDPDTNEQLGREEVHVGRATIKSVQPKTSTAELQEDNGVATGGVLRLVTAK